MEQCFLLHVFCGVLYFIIVHYSVLVVDNLKYDLQFSHMICYEQNL